MTLRFSNRMQRRLLRHHLPLALVCGASIAGLYVTRGRGDVISWLSFATAYPALVLICATLLMGPWNVMRRRPNPVSADLRRDVGIWAGIVSVIHAGIGQCVHLRGRPWLYYVYGPGEHHHGMRHDAFGIANYTGAIGVVLIAMLFATSNDVSLRRWGTARWKSVQRWNYAAFALSAAHTIGYFVVEKQKAPNVTFAAVCIGITAVVQTWGFALKKKAMAGAAIR